MFAESEMRGSPHLRWFVLLSIALHLVGMVLAATIPLKKEAPDLPGVYTVGIVEAPEPPPPVIQEPVTPPQAPPATGGVRVPPPKAARKTPKETVPPHEEVIKEAVEKAPPPVPEKAVEPSEEVAAAPPGPGIPEAPPLPTVPGREGIPAPGGEAGVPDAKKPPSLPRDGIFDRDVVRMFSKIEKPPIVAPKDTITFNPEDMKYKPYLTKLVEITNNFGKENKEIYPREAVEKNIEGAGVVVMEIRKDGSVGRIRIKQSSGHVILDRAIVSWIRAAERYYWPFPREWNIEAINFTVPFEFTIIRGFYLYDAR